MVTSNWDLKTTPLKVTISRNNDATTDTEVTVNQTPQVVKFAPSESAGYRIIAVYETDKTCGRGTFSNQAVIVPVRPRPTSYIYGDRSVCFGETVDVTIDLTPSNGSLWNVVVNDGKLNYNIKTDKTPYTFNYTPVESGTVDLKVISVSDDYCSSVVDDMEGVAQITTHQLPAITMAGSKTICDGESTDLEFIITGGKASIYIVILLYVRRQ